MGRIVVRRIGAVGTRCIFVGVDVCVGAGVGVELFPRGGCSRAGGSSGGFWHYSTHQQFIEFTLFLIYPVTRMIWLKVTGTAYMIDALSVVTVTVIGVAYYS